MFTKIINRLINNSYILKAKNFVKYPKAFFEIKKFVRLMNSKAIIINMTNSRFYNPSGASIRSYSTALDLSRLCLYAINNDFIANMWGNDNTEIRIKGPNNRLIITENILFKNCIPQLKNMILGGKSGSWSNRHKAHIFYLNIKNSKYLLSILSKDVISFNKIYNIAYEICTNGFNNQKGYYTKIMLDNNGGFLFKNLDTNDVLCENENKKMVPASVTKILTAICALELGINLNTPIIISPVDISLGSGSKFFPGDVLSLSDALRIMIFESSNTMANAIARTVGSYL